jgi:hypothetical protein
MSPNRSVIPANPPGVAMLMDHMDDQFNVNGASGSENGAGKDRKKNFGSLFGRSSKDKVAKNERQSLQKSPAIPSAIPSPIPPRPQQVNNPILPYSSMGSQVVNVPIADTATQRKKALTLPEKECICLLQLPKTSRQFLDCIGQEVPPRVFQMRWVLQYISTLTALSRIWPTNLATNILCTDPAMLNCMALNVLSVENQSLPVLMEKYLLSNTHLFDQEQMCPEHAKNPGRRCTGCHRFEPETEPFAELNDAGRCVCYSCCRSVVVDSEDCTTSLGWRS